MMCGWAPLRNRLEGCNAVTIGASAPRNEPDGVDIARVEGAGHKGAAGRTQHDGEIAALAHLHVLDFTPQRHTARFFRIQAEGHTGHAAQRLAVDAGDYTTVIHQLRYCAVRAGLLGEARHGQSGRDYREAKADPEISVYHFVSLQDSCFLLASMCWRLHPGWTRFFWARAFRGWPPTPIIVFADAILNASRMESGFSHNALRTGGLRRRLPCPLRWAITLSPR